MRLWRELIHEGELVRHLAEQFRRAWARVGVGGLRLTM